MKKNNNNKIFNSIPNEIEDSTVPWCDPIEEDYHVLVYEDKYPVTPGHLLYVPKYNSLGVLTDAFEDAFRYGKRMVETGQWDGYNIGINVGTAAGQTVDWPHIHLIPRRKDDTEDPTGGVRNVIAGRGNYKSVL